MADSTGTTAAAAFNFKQAIAQMIQRNGSDLLLKVGRAPTVRVNGDLATLEMAPLKPEDLKLLAEQVMTPRQVKEFAEKKEADFAIGVPGVGRFRTNIYQQRGTLAFAFRAIPYEVKTIRELNLPPILEEVSLKPRGIVLVTGITGSGKSTALASMIHHVNQHRRCNVITIEDPIEFLHRDVQSNISQREVGSDTLSFGAALRHVLRQDPDVILIGEVRDMETLDTALKAADTGHLVFSTLHTIDASKTVERIVGAFDAGEQLTVRSRLAASFRYFISQRLVPKQDGGRMAVLEILKSTMRTREYMQAGDNEGRTMLDAMRDGELDGMQCFDAELEKLIRSGVISMSTGLLNATNPGNLRVQLADVPDAPQEQKEEDSLIVRF